MKKKKEKNDEQDCTNATTVKKTFRSSNKIPHEVRTQMKSKKEAPDGLKTVTSVRKC